MAKIDLKSVYRVTSRGHTYYYAWKGKGAPRLRATPGSPEFIEELAAALAQRKQGDSRLISGLVSAYKASSAWKKLSPRTQIEWARWLDRINDRFGILSIRQFDRAQIRPRITQWRDEYADTPRAADMGMQVLSRILSFAVSEGLILVNPCKGIGHIYTENRAERIWTQEDMSALEKVASPQVLMAARLAALTGLRQGDLLRLRWSHIKANSIEISTGKSGGKKTTLIPLYAELRAFIATIPRRADTVLTNTKGLQWGVGFGSSWNKTMKAGQFGGLHFHDLRGTAATRFYLANLTIREIAEIMTWSEEQVERLINLYVKRDELLKDRIRRLDANGRETPLEKHSEKPPVDK